MTVSTSDVLSVISITVINLPLKKFSYQTSILYWLPAASVEYSLYQALPWPVTPPFHETFPDLLGRWSDFVGMRPGVVLVASSVPSQNVTIVY